MTSRDDADGFMNGRANGRSVRRADLTDRLTATKHARGLTAANANEDDDEDTFRSLLDRVDGDLDREISTSKIDIATMDLSQDTPPSSTGHLSVVTAIAEASAGPEASAGNVVVPLPVRKKPRPEPEQKPEAPTQQLQASHPAASVPASNRSPALLRRQDKWYDNNWAVIGASIAVSLAICSPLVLFLSWSLESKQAIQSDKPRLAIELSDAKAPPVLEPRDLFSIPPPLPVTEAVTEAEASPPGVTSEPPPAPLFGNVTASPRLLQQPRRALRSDSPNFTGPAPEAAHVLISQGKKALAAGDIKVAREAFRAAADSGSAAGAFAMAETFDPNTTARLPGARIDRDAQQARKWYLISLELGGVANLGGRIKALLRR